jgi:hypothetical protein
MALVRIRRSDDYADSMRRYRILVDGDEVGGVEVGQSAVFRLGPGHHVVQMAVGRHRSERVDVGGDQEDAIRLRCGPVTFSRLWRIALRDPFRGGDGVQLYLEPDIGEQL